MRLTEPMDLARMRLDYSEHGIDEQALLDDPIAQWALWLSDAVEAGLDEPNAMVIATVSENRPRTRAVLAKGASHGGIDFYTNYHSRKGQALGEAGPVSATFVWYPLQRQITMIGSASKVSAAESDDYFALRPRASAVGRVDQRTVDCDPIPGCSGRTVRPLRCPLPR